MTRLLGLLPVLLLAACPGGSGAPDAAADRDGGALLSCLEWPGALPRPPGGALPCELLSPDFTGAR